MATNQLWEFERYPKFKQLYIKAFQRMVDKMVANGKKLREPWTSGESIFKWWTNDYSEIDGQMSLFDFEEQSER